MISDISNENHLHGNGITSVWIVHFYFPLNVHSYSIIYTEEEKLYGDEFFRPEEEIEFVDLEDVIEKKMVAEGKSR